MDESWEYIEHARKLVVEDKYNKAFDTFLMAINRNPYMRAANEVEFRGILLRLNSMLAESNKTKVIFDNFGRALKAYPDNVHILNDLGKYLYKYGFYREAWEHFEKVLNISPSYADAEKNLNSIKNVLVERWHYRMLNDSIRNESYRQAIHQTVASDEKRVLDVGTGTGLLAIYAHETGANNIIGCDGSVVMSSVAVNIIRNNKIKNIKIINGMSTNLSLLDLGGRCSVLLTEMFDAGLFGEHVLQMLSHAWPTLLTEKAKVIPKTAEFFVAGAQCDHLIKNYQLCSEAKKILNISSLNVHISTDGETYDCEDVHLIKDLKYLTEPQSVLNVNFNDLKDIEDILKRTEPYKLELKAKEQGQMNIVIGWFNLYLSDINTITTDPKAPDRANAWQQAVFFDDIPKDVEENEIINMEFLMNGGKLTKVNSFNGLITRASEEIIRFLNDLEYIKMIMECLAMACVYLGQLADMSQITVVDLCPFPVFGLHMLKRGAKSLLCCASNEHDKEFIVKVFSDNNVSMTNVTIVYGDDWTPDIFKKEKYHAIFTHMVEVCGDVSIRLKEIAEYLKRSHLIRGGLYMPAQVKLIAQLISSRWLDINNKVYDENVSNYAMATQMNRYSVTQNFGIDFSTLKYIPMSEPLVLCNYPNGKRLKAKTVRIINNGYANAILCWYNIELMENSHEISTNRPNSLISGMLYLTYSEQEFSAGKLVKIIQHKDKDGSYKLVMEPVRSR